MAVEITIDIQKSINVAEQGGPLYEADISVASADNIDPNVFVFSFPGFEFDHVANPYDMITYPEYDAQNPPPSLTKFVRLNSVSFSLPNVQAVTSAIDVMKVDLRLLCFEWNTYNVNFTEDEQYTVSSD